MIQKSITKTFALENCLQTLAYSLKNVKYIQKAKGQITLSSKQDLSGCSYYNEGEINYFTFKVGTFDLHR